MKRLIAVFLALSMLITCAPLSALAAPGNYLAQPAVEQADASKAELLRQIASDPLLRAPAVQTAQQRDEATVDTSDTSVTATDSFGRLLLDGMDDSVNGTDFSGANRVIGIKINDATATVEFVAAETADLVVGIYTDDDAQKMVASGTMEVQPTAANTGSTTVVVPLTGTIPNYFTAKGYLLDKTEHAPLSSAYLSSEHTKVIEEIKNATIDDFPEEKVINLDADPSTNFAVVADGVVHAAEGENDTADSENDIAAQNSAAFNNVTFADAESQIYIIENPSNRVKYLRSKQIFVLKYDETNMIVTRVDTTEQNGDVITIHGVLDFKLEDAFDFLKLEEQTGGDKQYHYVEGTGDESLTYLGEEYSAGVDETNAVDINIPITLQSKFQLSKPETIEGSAKFGVTGTFKFYLSAGQKELAVSAKAYANISAKFEQTRMEVSVPFGVYEFSPIAGIYMAIRPTFKFSLKNSVTTTLSIESTAGCEWVNYNYQPTSKDPYIKFEVKLEGEVFLGLDLEPSVKVFSRAIEIKFKTQFGADMKFTRKAASWDTSNPSQMEEKIDPNNWHNSPTSYHACVNCYEISTGLNLTIGMTISLVGEVVSRASDLNVPISVGVAKGHYSVDYSEFTLFGGKCDHEKYRIVVSMDKADSAGTKLYCSKNGGMYQGAGELNSQGWLQIFLEPGTYTFSTVPDSKAEERYYCTFAVTDMPLNPLLRYATRSGVCGAEDGNLTWEISDSGMLSISGTGEMKDYSETSPAPWPKEEVTGVEIQAGVTSIGSYAFAGCYRMLSANISGTVDTINDHAFSGCLALSRADLSDDLVVLGPYAFENCKKLESFDVGGCLLRLEDGVFDGCTALKNVQLHEVMEIGAAAFRSCSSLQKLDAPCVLSIGDDAFNGCTALKNVQLHEVMEIGAAAFRSCSSLQKLDAPCVLSIGDDAFNGCSALETITFAKQLSSFGVRSFYNCTSLTKINIPDSVTVIPQQAFYQCTSLNSIWLPDSVTTVEEEAFKLCRSAATIRLSNRLASIGQGAFYGCESFAGKQQFTPSGSSTPIATTLLILPETLTFIGDSAFEACTKLDGVKFPEHLNAIGSNAFQNCSSLSQAILPNDLQHFGKAVFAGCTSLTEVSIPHDISRIAVNTFDGCTALQVVHLPAGTDLIADSAFNGCTALQRVEYKGTVGDWYNVQIEDHNEVLYTTPIFCSNGDTFGHKTTHGTLSNGIKWFFSNDATLFLRGTGPMVDFELNATDDTVVVPWEDVKYNISHVVYEEGITTTGDFIFYKCPNLTSVTLPDTMTEIGNSTFSGCTSLEQVTISNGVTKIGNSAFSGCSRLEQITIPDSVTKISAGAFAETELTQVSVPGVAEIGVNAFGKCWKLTQIHVSTPLVTVESGAFEGCSELMDVYYSGTAEQWQAVNNQDATIADANIHCADQEIPGVKHGTWNGVTWRLAPDGTLTVSGHGSITARYSWWFPWDSFKEEILKIVIEDGITSVGTNAFPDCPNLKTVEIAGSVTSLEERAFANCHKLEEVHLSEGLKNIGSSALGGTAIRTIELPESLETLGCGAFGWCPNLESIRIPSNVWGLDRAVFTSCDNLTEVWLPRSLRYIDVTLPGYTRYSNQTCFPDSVQTFHYEGTSDDWRKIQIGGGNSNLKEATIYGADGPFTIRSGDCGEEGDNVQWTLSEDGTLTITGSGKIRGYSNSDNRGYYGYTTDDSSPWPETLVKRVVIGEGITEIGDNVFIDSWNLEEIDLPTSLTRIGVLAFAFCSSLYAISIPTNVTEIGQLAFRDDTSLSYLIFPDVDTIREGMFIDCPALESITIPSSVTSIENQAFDCCGALKDVYFLGTKEQWSKISIGRDNTDLTSATIHYIDTSAAAMDAVMADVAAPDDLLDAADPEPAEPEWSADAEEDAPEVTDLLLDLTEADIEPEASGFDAVSVLPTVPEQLGADAVPEVLADTSNAIAVGSGVTEDGGVSHARFTGLTAGEDYAVIVSSSADAPLDGANLLYITQTAAAADGTLDVPFCTHSTGDAAYVVACRRGNDSHGGDTSGGDTSGGGTSGGDTSGGDTSGGGTSGGSTSGGSTSSGGAGGLLAILAGGVAVIVAGIIALLPAKISGRVERADHTVLANADVQLLQNNTVVARTTTDANGSFTLSVKRSKYVLRITYPVTTVDEAGQPITRTVTQDVPVKAPASGLTLRF